MKAILVVPWVGVSVCYDWEGCLFVGGLVSAVRLCVEGGRKGADSRLIWAEDK